MSNLLLLEDDISLIDGLNYSLKKNGFCVDIARTVEEVNIIRGLDCGGDDYVTKPFRLGELCSRIRALLRRAGISPQDKTNVLECGDISIDLLGCCVTLDNRALELTNAEYRLLCLLVRNANRIVSRDIIGENSIGNSLPCFSQFQYHSFLKICLLCIVLILILLAGVSAFLWIRNRLFQQAGKIVGNYINNDYSCHLPQHSEGEIFHLFASVEQLATILQSQKDTEHKTKEFLKNTISDISHQLKTPLAALAMYQEIIENESDNVETVKEFSGKIGAALKRMEQLISSMLKINKLS